MYWTPVTADSVALIAASGAVNWTVLPLLPAVKSASDSPKAVLTVSTPWLADRVTVSLPSPGASFTSISTTAFAGHLTKVAVSSAVNGCGGTAGGTVHGNCGGSLTAITVIDTVAVVGGTMPPVLPLSSAVIVSASGPL